jgi:hypothetical protein
MQREEGPKARILYQAGIVAFHEIHQKLEYLRLEPLRPREPRADGSWIERVILRPDQIEPVVAAGAVVVLEGLVDLRVPPEWIMSREEALGRLETAARESGYRPAGSEE